MNKLPSKLAGNSKFGAQWNVMRSLLGRARVGMGGQGMSGPFGTTVAYRLNLGMGGGSGGSAVAIYKITSIANVASNYVAAKEVTFDDTNAESLAATAINIAIPHELRKTVYYVDDYITVAEAPTGTGVVVSSAQLTFIDLAAGRINWKFMLKSIQKDYLTCRSLVISSGGTYTEGSVDVFIAKMPELRGTIADMDRVIDGVTVTYDTFAATTYVTRNANWSGSIQKENITPRYLVDDCIIEAKLVVNGTGVWKDGVELVLQEDSPRHWTRKYDQS
jgi:hypothetical protein